MNNKDFKELIKKLLRSPFNDSLAVLAMAGVAGVEKFFGSTALLGIVGFWASLTLLIASTAWLVFRIGRTVYGEPPSLEGVTAIGARGLIPFTEKDSALFWKLGRSNDIRRLLAYVQNTNSAVIVLHGEDGVGKTSVLWAGLKPVLKQQDIQCVYCDTAVDDPVDAVRNAIFNALKIDLGRSVEEAAKIQARSVLILDSFEQVDVDRSEHAPLFALLRALHRQSAPYSLQVIVAYRDDYRARWFEIERRTGIRGTHQPLALLSQDAAIEALETILEEAGINVDRSVIHGYVRTATGGSGVSPVDIAVGAQIFESWASRLSKRHLHSAVYASTGGSLGVLMAHVEAQLDDSYVRSEDRPALIRGLANAFVVDEGEGRKLSGVSPTELAAITGLNVDLLADDYLPRLASRISRVLEAISEKGSTKYRLSRDSMALVLKQLASELNTKSTRTELFLLERYDLWRRTQRRRDLLSGDFLKLAVQHLKSDHFHNAEMISYIRKSRTANRIRHTRNLSVTLVGMVVVASLAVFGATKIQELKLHSWRLPPDLYEHQGQLESLRIQGYSVSELEWLKSNNYRTLEITDSRLTSITGLSNPRTIEDLTIDLTETPVESLKDVARIPGLTTLTVFLGRSKVENLSDLQQATKLTNLSLYLGGSAINSLNELSKMPLKHLSLHLAGSSIHDLTPVKQIKTLDTLELHLDSTQLALVADLNGSDGLHHLMLNIENPRNVHEIPPTREIPSLAGMQNVTDLTLRFKPSPDQAYLPADAFVSPIGNLDRLRLPSQLVRLNIDLGGFPVAVLPEVSHLTNLVHLELHLQGSGIRRLPEFRSFHGLTELELALDTNQMGGLDLSNLNGIETLKLALMGEDISSLPALPSHNQLRNIALDVSRTSISELRVLPALRSLGTLELHLKASQLEKLPSLSALPDLGALSLYVAGETIRELPVLGISHDLPTLTLGFNGSSMDRLPPLTQFKNVKNLTVSIAGSRINTLEEIGNLSTMNTLTLDVSDTQRLQTMPDLNQFHDLTDITLILGGSSLRSLPDMSGLKRLSALNINLRNSHISDLNQLRHLLALQDLTLDQNFGSLDGLPQSVHRLAFSWRH